MMKREAQVINSLIEEMSISYLVHPLRTSSTYYLMMCAYEISNSNSNGKSAGTTDALILSRDISEFMRQSQLLLFQSSSLLCRSHLLPLHKQLVRVLLILISILMTFWLDFLINKHSRCQRYECESYHMLLVSTASQATGTDGPNGIPWWCSYRGYCPLQGVIL